MANEVQLNSTSANFYVSVALNVDNLAATPFQAPFVNHLSDQAKNAAVVLAPAFENAALAKGLYVQVGGVFVLALTSQDLSAQLESNAQISVYANVPTAFTIPAGAAAFKNGVATTETTIPALQPNVIWTVATKADGGTVTPGDLPVATATTIGAVSVPANTGLTLSGAGALSGAPATTAALGVVQIGTGLGVTGAGVVSVAAVAAAAGSIGGVTRQATIVALTDNSGGTASTTNTIAAIAAIGDAANAVATIAARLNSLYTSLRAAGIIV